MNTRQIFLAFPLDKGLPDLLRQIPESGKFHWAYLGSDYRQILELEKGALKQWPRISISEKLQVTAGDYRSQYIEWIGEMGQERNSLPWWAGSISDKCPYTSSLFLHICYLKIALELIEETGELDYLLAPVGGGGLLSGSALSAKGLRPSTKVWGVEPAGADDAFRSFKEGRIVPQTNPRTIADGLRTSLGEKTFPVIRSFVDEIALAGEEEILQAMRFLWERMKLVVEPSGAVPLVPLLNGSLRSAGKTPRVGVIVSGGNVSLEAFFDSFQQKK